MGFACKILARRSKLIKKRKGKQSKLRRLEARLPMHVRAANVSGTATPKQRVEAAELPLRTFAANKGGIAARNEKLAALKASALRADLTRVEQMLGDMPFTQNKQVVEAAEQLRKDPAKIAAR